MKYHETISLLTWFDQLTKGSLRVSQEKDNSGQIVLHTGMFQWRDGSIRVEPDPNYALDELDL